MSEEVEIIEKKHVPHGAVMLFGFPDVGLVGVIAASHLISELNLTEMAYMDSRLLPPLIVLHEGLPHSPIRIFGNHNILLAVSETAISADVIYPIMHGLIDWGRSKNVKMMISMSGIPVQDRQDIDELKVFAAASSQETLKIVQDKGIEVLKEGYMVGPQAVTMQYCASKGVPAITLLAQCFFKYPDPEAAAEVLIEKPSWNRRARTIEPLRDVMVAPTEVTVTVDLPYAEENTIQIKPIGKDIIEILAKMNRKVRFDDFGIPHCKGEFQTLHCQTRIPVPVHMDKMEIRFKKGILEIRLPRKHEHEIPIE